MQLPLLSQPCLAFFDAHQGVTNYKGSNGSLNVESIVDRITGAAAIQGTETAKPTFTKVNKKLASYPGWDFAGAHHFSFDRLSASLGSKFTIVLVSTCSTPASASNQTFLSIGGATAKTYFYAASSNIQLVDTNDANSTSSANTGITLDGNSHVYTLLVDKSAGTVKLRQDGIQIGSLSGLTGNHTYTYFTMGALNVGGSVSAQFNGSIGGAAVASGVVDYTSLESFFRTKYQTL